jgi:cellulose synthase/poly-beta-1,6-N-acetylglucosamine synthase-like glycosyltransferase
MKAPTLPKPTRGRKWLLIAIANLILETLLSLALYSMFGMIGLAAVIFFQAFLLMTWAWVYDPQELTTQQVKGK